MLNIAAIIQKNAHLLPRKEAMSEAFGYFVLGSGIFLALAVFSYNPDDLIALRNGGNVSHNLAGPLGAQLAYLLLGLFGTTALIWPFVITLWGSLVAFGLAWIPQPQRVVGLLALSIVLAGFAHIELATWDLREPVFGFGGILGKAFGGFAATKFGYLGGYVFLSFVAMSVLVLTGNLSLVGLKAKIVYFATRVRKFLIKQYESYQKAEISDEEFIKAALREVAKESKTLYGVLQQPAVPVAADGAMALPMKKSKAPAKKKDAIANIDLTDLAQEAVVELAADESADGAANINLSTLKFYYDGAKSHGRPEPGMFSKSSKAKDRSAEFEKMGIKLTKQLEQFKVEGKVTKIVEGPVVTTYEFEPVPGTKVSKITGLAQDLARLLQANSLRILAPIPGKKVVGFEVPNSERRTIGFADLVAHRDLRASKVALPVAMGVDAFGSVVIEDLAKMPHLLVAGSTGSGKSVFMNTLIGGLIARHSAKDLRFIMIDPKMVELAAYNALPHMVCPVITDPAGEAKEKLDALVLEMEDRFNKMRMVGARNIQGFNEVIKEKKKADFPEFTDKWQSMPYIVLIIDELADMMMVLGKDAEVPITRLAQKARAAGIHLVIATQRPSAEVVTGLIKANFPTRIAFRVLSGLDSRTILDTSGAEGLIGQGDMLYLNAAGLRRMHGAYLSDSEVQKMVKACKPK